MKSFTIRITAQFAVLVTATTAVVLLVGGWLLSRQAVRGLDLMNQAEFAEVRNRLGTTPNALTAVEVDRRVRAHSEVDAALYFFQVQNASNEILFRSANLGQSTLPPPPDDAAAWTGELRGVGQVRTSVFSLGGLRVQIASPLQPALQLMRNYAKTSLVLLGGVSLASVGLGWYFAALALRPVRAIRTTAGRIRGDNLSERIPVPAGRDELSALVVLLNQMFDRLESSFSQVKQFTADASHELKTPLALLRLNAEKLRPKLVGDADASEVLDSMLEDLDRMQRIIDSLLFLAKADSGGIAPALTTVRTEELARDFAADAAALAEDRGVMFQLGRVDAGSARCEVTLIRQLLLNLISNALRVVPAGGRITLDSECTDAKWTLTLSDEGPGLPEAQLQHIFERFVRFDPTAKRSENESGQGLGLAICRSIALLHGGSIRAENRADRAGLRVIVELPR